MICKKCGSEMPEDLNYCYQCGSLLKKDIYMDDEYYERWMTERLAEKEERKVVSVGGWFGRYFLQYIPIVGWLVWFIMLWVWSFNRSKEETFRNWARAQLWLIFFWLILALVLFVLIFSLTTCTYYQVSTQPIYY